MFRRNTPACLRDIVPPHESKRLMTSAFAVFALALTTSALPTWAQPPAGTPPSKVNVAPVEQGKLSPTTEVNGTVRFKELAELATEVSGRVIGVHFEEGDHLKQGSALIELDHALLDSRLKSLQALCEKNRMQLLLEQTRLERAKTLLKDEVTTPQEVDDLKYTVESLEASLAAAMANVEELQREIQKKTTYAPFDGIVVKRMTELGQWKQPGSSIALLARDNVFDVIVHVPQSRLAFIEPGLKVQMRVDGREFSGEVVAILPQGDPTTQQFPIKVRVTGIDWLLDGLSVMAELPSGEHTECLLVPRDALIVDRGEHFVFVANDGVATRVPITLIGTQGLNAGIEANGIQAGMEVVVKGHERLREGQPVEVVR